MERFKYVHMRTGEEVRDVDAIDYVSEKCGFEMVNETPETKDFVNNIVEWFFSGNWIQMEDDS